MDVVEDIAQVGGHGPAVVTVSAPAWISMVR